MTSAGSARGSRRAGRNRSARGAGQAGRLSPGAHATSDRSGRWLATGELLHVAGPKPLPEAVDERCATLRSVSIVASWGKFRLLGLHTFGDGDGEAQRLEAEAGVDRLDDALESQIDEARDMFRATCRHRQADIDRHHLAIDAVEGKPQAACPRSVANEARDDVLHEVGCAQNDRLLRADRLEQLAQAVVGGGRSEEGERLGQAAEGLVEASEEFGQKARGKGCAGVVEQRSDVLEAEPAQRCAGVGRKTQHLDRQRCESCSLLSRRQDSSGGAMEMGEGPGCPRRIGDGKPRRQAEPLETTKQGGKQLFLAAEQMC